MPELPEVETYVRALRRPLIGRTILGARVYWPGTIAQPAPAAFRRQVVGRRIRAVNRRAKYVVVELAAADSGQPSFLLIHLKMTGQLAVAPRERPIDKHDRVIFDLSGGRQLRFNDARKFGRIHLVSRPEAVTHRLGPEPLSDEFSLDAFRERIAGRSGRLKSLLLDQTFVAGIGNIYADEALWLALLHPLRRAGGLTEAERRALYRAIRTALRDGIRRSGATFDWAYPTGDYRFRVYDRQGQPCRRCRRPIRRIVVGQRGTHFCAHCQTVRD